MGATRMPPAQPPLSSVLPPLIFGTATFNYQYTADPYKLPTTALVHNAFSVGVRAFDTSPYYGPAEEILGDSIVSKFKIFPNQTTLSRQGPNHLIRRDQHALPPQRLLHRHESRPNRQLRVQLQRTLGLQVDSTLPRPSPH